MNIQNEIDAIKEKNTSLKSKSRQEKTELYCEGLKAKLEQASFALSCVEKFTNLSDDTKSTTEEISFSISMQVAFYCDTFWTFLYSSLDVLSQIVNQTMALGLKEKDVSFNQIKGKLGGTVHKDLEVSIRYNKCFKSRAFKNLEKYRNCSTHRRQIFIVELCETKSVRRTAGYPSTATTDSTSIATTDSTSTIVTRTLCDDPLTQKPKIEKKRIIPQYMVETQNSIIKSIKEIIKAIEFKR